jgi:hypothetical protein
VRCPAMGVGMRGLCHASLTIEGTYTCWKKPAASASGQLTCVALRRELVLVQDDCMRVVSEQQQAVQGQHRQQPVTGHPRKVVAGDFSEHMRHLLPLRGQLGVPAYFGGGGC